jgi:hypothetical protein
VIAAARPVIAAARSGSRTTPRPPAQQLVGFARVDLEPGASAWTRRLLLALAAQVVERRRPPDPRSLRRPVKKRLIVMAITSRAHGPR